MDSTDIRLLPVLARFRLARGWQDGAVREAGVKLGLQLVERRYNWAEDLARTLGIVAMGTRATPTLLTATEFCRMILGSRLSLYAAQWEGLKCWITENHTTPHMLSSGCEDGGWNFGMLRGAIPGPIRSEWTDFPGRLIVGWYGECCHGKPGAPCFRDTRACTNLPIVVCKHWYLSRKGLCSGWGRFSGPIPG